MAVSWKATGVRCMGHWLLQPLSGAVHAGMAGSGCPPSPVGCRDGAGRVENTQVRDRREKRQADGVVVTWCLPSEASSKALFRGVGGLDVSQGLRECACFLFSETWASLLLHVHLVCGCVCVDGCALHLRTCTCPHIRA